LVKTQIIDHWESQDEPEHLRTIRDRLLYSEQSRALLLLYQQILAGKQLLANNELTQFELRLTGLVSKVGGELVVANPIYHNIFNQAWVDQQHSVQPSPAESVYRTSGVSDLWDRLIEDSN